MGSSNSILYGLAAVSGTIAHLICSPIPEFSTIKYILGYLTGNILLVSYIISSTFSHLPTGPAITSTLYSTLTTNLIFVSTCTLLTLTRRLYFSNLTRFPGPKLAALSKLWSANEYRHGRASVTLRALHEKYKSDFVRIGPRELSINCVEAVEKIYKGKYVRGTFYEVGAANKEVNLNTARDYSVHTPWRRIWYVLFWFLSIKRG